MKHLLKNAAFRFFVAVLAVLLLGSLLSFALRGASPLTSLVGLVTTPLQTISAKLANRCKDGLAYFRSSHALQQQLKQQQRIINDLRDRLVGYDEAQKKLRLYQEVLELKEENPKLQVDDASIIGIDPGGLFSQFTLNKGSVSGIQPQMPVISDKYVVGVVSKVELTSCTVQTILNPNVFVSVYETMTNETGVLGTTSQLSKKGMCAISQLERDTAITAGSLISTAGTGGVFPRGLMVGTVQDIQNDPQNLYAIATVQPAVAFAELRDVIIITSY